MRRLRIWASEWIETLKVAPPFSRRRRDLLAVIAEAELDRGKRFGFKSER